MAVRLLPHRCCLVRTKFWFSIRSRGVDYVRVPLTLSTSPSGADLQSKSGVKKTNRRRTAEASWRASDSYPSHKNGKTV